MNIEIFKTKPGDELFVTFKLDNGNWITYKGTEKTDSSRAFNFELDIKVNEHAHWLINHLHKND
jgi:hypothetical protein